MSQQLSQLRHAFLRGRTWYTNFKMNASSRYIRLSLGTDSLKQASLIMNQVMPFIPLVQNGTMALEEFKLKLQGYRAATKQDFDNYLLRALQSDVAEVKRLPQLGQYHRAIFPESSLSPTATVEEAKRGSEVHLNRMYSGDDLSAREVLSALKMQKLEFSSEDLPRVNEVAGELDMSRATVQQAYSAFYSGDLPRYRQLLETLQLQLKDAEQKTIPPEQKSLPVDVEESSSTEGNAIPLSEAWDMYVKEKGKKWSRAVAGENNRFYEVLAHVVGDRPVNTITKAQIRDALKVAENLPTRNRKPYSSMGLEECIAYDIPEEDLISSQHVGKHLKIWRSLFKTYLVDAKDILEKSPTEGIKFTVNPNRRGHYNSNELLRLKDHLKNLPDSNVFKWYFLSLIFTGARRSEIASIRKEHIRKDEETGRYYIFIEEGKSQHAQRQIPLNRVLESGLLNQIRNMKDGEIVFKNLPDYTTTTNEWINIMRACGIDDYDEFGLKRRLHSCRHTFMSDCLASGVSIPLMQFVVGHSRSQSLGVTSIYTHRPPLRDLLCVVDFQK